MFNHNPMWVKAIDENGRIENFDWRPVYKALRAATGHTYPGYLWHEAVHWDALHRVWVVLPRKASASRYSVAEDQRKGTNLLLLASEDFADIQVCKRDGCAAAWAGGRVLTRGLQVRTIGPVEPEYGFTSVRSAWPRAVRSVRRPRVVLTCGTLPARRDAEVPGTNDTYAALKVHEVDGRTHTRMTVFNLRGEFLMDPPFQDVADDKFEGLAFL